MRYHLKAWLLMLAVLLASMPATRADSGNVGIFTLVATQITTALSSQAQTQIDSLDGATAVTLVATFAYGSGGTSASATVQATLDGTNWFDVARFDFLTASATKYANLSGLTAKGITAYSSLPSEGVNDGLLGTSLRVVLTTVGTYANTTLSVVASVR